MTTTVNFSSPETAILSQDVPVSERYSSIQDKLNDWLQKDREKFDDYFEIDRIISKAQKYHNIGLQFPDELLTFAVPIVQALKAKLQNSSSYFHVLGDSSYSPCCIDEIAAEHTHCDLIVHFGRTCLSPTKRIDTIFIFGKEPIHSEKFVEKLAQKSKEEFPEKIPFFLFYNPCFHHAISRIQQLIQKNPQLANRAIFLAQCDIEREKDDSLLQNATLPKSEKQKNLFGRYVPREWPDDWKDAGLFYIGHKHDQTLISLSLSQPEAKVFVFNPASSEMEMDSFETNSLLMSRYFLVEKAKDAKVIGLVVQTLSVVDYLQLLDDLKKVIQSSGRKAYTFVIGKINPPKMANFELIDLFVLISCHENVLFTSREYLVPMISPYELKLALSFADWTNKIETQIPQILQAQFEKKPQSEEDEIFHYSFTKGMYTSEKINNNNNNNNNNTNLEISTENEKSLAKRNNTQELAKLWGPAAASLAKREYKGLDPQLGKTPVGKIEQGLSGIPKSYSSEVPDQNEN